MQQTSTTPSVLGVHIMESSITRIIKDGDQFHVWDDSDSLFGGYIGTFEGQEYRDLFEAASIERGYQVTGMTLMEQDGQPYLVNLVP